MLLFADAIFMFFKYFEELAHDEEPAAVHVVYPLVRSLTMASDPSHAMNVFTGRFRQGSSYV